MTWDNLITTIPGTITLDDLAAKICVEDIRRQDQDLYPKPHNQALYFASQSRPKHSNPKADLTCNNCKLIRHVAAVRN